MAKVASKKRKNQSVEDLLYTLAKTWAQRGARVYYRGVRILS